MEKVRLFVWGDAIVPTGFSRVLHSIVGNLPEEQYDITWLGINYYGDPHDYKLKVYPANVGGGRDQLGFNRLGDVLRISNPQLILLLGDVWQQNSFIEAIKKEYTDGSIPPTFCYFPVDARDHAADWYKNLHEVYPVTYTQFGHDVAKAARSDIEYYIIPHGTDTDKFYRIEDREEVLKKAFPKDSEKFRDNFIVLNANRNQPRKRLDVTMRGFALFAKNKPENVRLYMHCGIIDSSVDVPDLARRYGIESRLIISSAQQGVQQVSDKRLNYIYNACNVGINTSLGEGWGLCLHEMTPIWTVEGIKRLKDVAVGDTVITHTGSAKKVMNVFDNGEKDLVKLELCNKRVLHCTKEHEVLTLDGFKEVGNLTNEDFVALSTIKFEKDDIILDLAENPKYFCDDNFVWLRNSPADIVDKKKRFLSVNNDLAMLIGSYLSRGKVIRGKCQITMRTEEDARELVTRLLALKVEARIEFLTKFKKALVTFSDPFIVELLVEKFGARMRSKKIPREFFSANLFEVIKYYIRNRYKILLSYRGLQRISFRAFTQSLASFIVHQLYGNDIVTSAIYQENFQGPFFAFNVQTSFRHKLLENRYEAYDSPVYKKEDGRYYVKVLSVKVDSELERGHVYDLEIEDDHSYVANGIVVHNCSVEHAVTGAVQVVPDSSACRELFEGCGVLIPAKIDFVQDNINTTGKLILAEDVAESLEFVYRNPVEADRLALLAKEKFSSPMYNWKNISNIWHNVFQEVLNVNNVAQ